MGAIVQVAIRVDASNEIGTGHLMRCITLAQELTENGADCIFVCREHQSGLYESLIPDNFSLIKLKSGSEDSDPIRDEDDLEHGKWLGVNWQVDALDTIAQISDLHIDLLIVDHYGIDARWEKKLRAVCKKILVIDDLADRVHDCDFLVDQNLVQDYQFRYKNKVPKACITMLGTEYALLQKEYRAFRNPKKIRNGKIERILIYFGGSDINNLTGKAIQALINLDADEICIDVVVGGTNAHAKELEAQVSELHNIKLYHQTASLAPLMLAADLSIGAGGATTWERCCMGLPSLVISVANNQLEICRHLSKLGLIKSLSLKHAENINSLTLSLKNILDSNIESEWSKRCYEVVDGCGVKRVLDVIQASISPKIQIISIDGADSENYKKIINGLLTKVMSEAAVSTFFKNVDQKIYLIRNGEALICGLVSFSRSDDGWQMNYLLEEIAYKLDLCRHVLCDAILEFRRGQNHLLRFCGVNNLQEVATISDAGERIATPIIISFCSDQNSWINPSIAELLLDLLNAGHAVSWAHNADDLKGGDLCFYLSYSRIVKKTIRSKYLENLVVHASDLPSGKGWSPASWKILEGSSEIVVSLLSAVEKVDSGPIFLQERINLKGTELIVEWQHLLAKSTMSLVGKFIDNYPKVLSQGIEQSGLESWYPRRRPEDSELCVQKNIRDQFNLLRVVDNEKYPAFFIHNGRKYILKIYPG